MDIELFGADLIDKKDFLELIFRYAINLFTSIIVIRLIYYPITRQKDYLFSFIVLNTVIFFICILLNNVKLELGLALGLFAIFGILRYRTEAVPIKEMTYLFAIIGIAVINALSNKKVSMAELAFTNIGIMSITFLLEKVWLLKHESKKTVLYEDISLISPDQHPKLINELNKRTGLPIHKIEIKSIDFLRDTAQIQIFYYEDKL